MDKNKNRYYGGSKYFIYVIFEYNGWPADRYITYPFGYGDVDISYRSWESPFASGNYKESEMYKENLPHEPGPVLYGKHGEFTFETEYGK